MKYYIAYGSNLNLRQMLHRCPESKVVGFSTIPDYELLFKGSKSGAYLTIEQSRYGAVPVGIWTVSESDEEMLDRYEGFPDFYYKKDFNLDVKMLNGSIKNLDCFAYIMHEERDLAIPSKSYLITCLEGYDDFGFDERYLIDAYERSDY